MIFLNKLLLTYIYCKAVTCKKLTFSLLPVVKGCESVPECLSETMSVLKFGLTSLFLFLFSFLKYMLMLGQERTQIKMSVTWVKYVGFVVY